jgi:hypothetical protein
LFRVLPDDPLTNSEEPVAVVSVVVARGVAALVEVVSAVVAKAVEALEVAVVALEVVVVALVEITVVVSVTKMLLI